MRFSTSTTTLSTALFFLPFAVVSAAGVDSGCPSVHLFLARGNGESYPGRIGAIVNTICPGVGSCDYEDIMFTSYAGIPYCQSIYEGANNGVAQITAYNNRCPNTKLILGGYSEGAHIVGDILGGGSGAFYDCYENQAGGLNAGSRPGNMIVAALMFGDTRHNGNQPYNVGTGSGLNGQYPRNGGELGALNAFSSKIQNYCLITDPICAMGNDGLSHETYMTVFAGTAGAWAISQVSRNVGPVQSPPPPPPSSSSTFVPPPPSSSTFSSSTLYPTTPSSTSVSITPTSSSVSSTESSTISSTTSSTTSSESSTITSVSSSQTASITPFVFSATSVEVTAATSAAPQTTLHTASTQPTSTSSTSKNGAAPTGYAMGMLGFAAVGALALV